jgi:hypothetical protein
LLLYGKARPEPSALLMRFLVEAASKVGIILK